MEWLINTILLMGCLLFLSGCSAHQWQKAPCKPYEPTNVFNCECIPCDINRVAVMPIYYKPYEGNFLVGLEGSFRGELNKAKLFEVVPISREFLEFNYQKRQFDSTDALPADLFRRIEDKTGAQAVLFIDLTYYSPYQPISIGVRLKLVNIHTGEVLWAFDEVFDQGNVRIGRSSYQYALYMSQVLYPLDNGESIFQSPDLFGKYVAFSVFSTIRKNCE